jgi:hypothetical protein
VKNPWLAYTLLRLGMFFGIFAVFMLLEFGALASTVFAAAISFALSLLFLDKQRDALSASVAKKLARDASGSYQDDESDLENEVLDSERNDKKPEADK